MHAWMEKVLIGCLAGLYDDNPRVIETARAALDFIQLSQYDSHWTLTLIAMTEALEDFHHHKQVFIELGVRDHFNIPKIHSMQHYVPSITEVGSCRDLSTDISERLHIEYAKLGYRASNKKDYVKQMVVWLARREKVVWFEAYLAWISATTPHRESPACPDILPTPSLASVLASLHRPATAKLPSESLVEASPSHCANIPACQTSSNTRPSITLDQRVVSLAAHVASRNASLWRSVEDVEMEDASVTVSLAYRFCTLAFVTDVTMH